MNYPCLYCSLEVRNIDLAISCDSCREWCHLHCETGITEEQYQAMVQGAILQWSCLVCRTNEQSYSSSDFDRLEPIVTIQEDDQIFAEAVEEIEEGDSPVTYIIITEVNLLLTTQPYSFGDVTHLIL